MEDWVPISRCPLPQGLPRFREHFEYYRPFRLDLLVELVLTCIDTCRMSANSPQDEPVVTANEVLHKHLDRVLLFQVFQLFSSQELGQSKQVAQGFLLTSLSQALATLSSQLTDLLNPLENYAALFDMEIMVFLVEPHGLKVRVYGNRSKIVTYLLHINGTYWALLPKKQAYGNIEWKEYFRPPQPIIPQRTGGTAQTFEFSSQLEHNQPTRENEIELRIMAGILLQLAPKTCQEGPLFDWIHAVYQSSWDRQRPSPINDIVQQTSAQHIPMSVKTLLEMNDEQLRKRKLSKVTGKPRGKPAFKKK